MILKISSDTLQLEIVEDFVNKIFNNFEVKRELFIKVLVCVNEAVVNSISHGNKYSNEKMVIIKCFNHGDYLEFKIEDEGEGFDFNDIPDPTTKENIKKETGRGIFLIRNISDHLSFRNAGKIIEFRIKLYEED